ncbi:MAG: hypothetical protein ACFFDN_23030 [Candidatus Hodarchaeota archaeon]
MKCSIKDKFGKNCPEDAVYTIKHQVTTVHLCPRCYINWENGAYGPYNPKIQSEKSSQWLKAAHEQTRKKLAPMKEAIIKAIFRGSNR